MMVDLTYILLFFLIISVSLVFLLLALNMRHTTYICEVPSGIKKIGDNMEEIIDEKFVIDSNKIQFIGKKSWKKPKFLNASESMHKVSFRAMPIYSSEQLLHDENTVLEERVKILLAGKFANKILDGDG